jgi:hypothetical protein
MSTSTPSSMAKVIPPPTSTNEGRTMSGTMDGKAALVTGAAAGIGRATAVAFAR